MALFRPDHGDPGEERVSHGSLGGAQAVQEERLLRSGRQVIARGSLVCPECDLPIPGRPAVAHSARLHCGWCGHAARAVDFLRRDFRDASANAVALVARLGVSPGPG